MQGQSGTPRWSRFDWLFERGVLDDVTDLLYEPAIHVRLQISQPGQWQREDVYTPTSNVDLLPTLLDAVGREIPDWCEGHVLPIGNGGSAERSVFAAEAKRNPACQLLHVGPLTLIRDDTSWFITWGKRPTTARTAVRSGKRPRGDERPVPVRNCASCRSSGVGSEEAR